MASSGREGSKDSSRESEEAGQSLSSSPSEKASLFMRISGRGRKASQSGGVPPFVGTDSSASDELSTSTSPPAPRKISSPRAESPKKEKYSPRPKGESPRKLFTNTDSPRPQRDERLLFPLTEEEAEYCIRTADSIIEREFKTEFQNWKDDKGEISGVFFQANDRDNLYVVVISKSETSRSGWRIFLIEKNYLKIDGIEASPRDGLVVQGEGNEGLVICSWDIRTKEKIATKIYHFRTGLKAISFERQGLAVFDRLEGQVDFPKEVYETKEIEKAKKKELEKEKKKEQEKDKDKSQDLVILMRNRITFQKFLALKKLLEILYKFNPAITDPNDSEFYLEKVDLPPLLVIPLLTQLFKVTLFFQEKEFTHRDLKADNMFYDLDKGLIYLSDFASCTETANIKPSDAFFGTYGLGAPETDKFNKDREQRFDRIDNYSIGLLLIELLTRKIFQKEILLKRAEIQRIEEVDRHLTVEEICELFADVCKRKSPPPSFDEQLSKLTADIMKTPSLYSAERIDRRLQDIIHECKTFNEYAQLALMLIKVKPSERLELRDAFARAQHLEQTFRNIYMAIKTQLDGKMLLRQLGISLEGVNQFTEQASDVLSAQTRERSPSLTGSHLRRGTVFRNGNGTPPSDDGRSPPPSPTASSSPSSSVPSPWSDKKFQ